MAKTLKRVSISYSNIGSISSSSESGLFLMTHGIAWVFLLLVLEVKMLLLLLLLLSSSSFISSSSFFLFFFFLYLNLILFVGHRENQI
jgi:hypothetical protein